ncbi:CPBP family glutamic-type intramembrane protease [Agrococcus casei]|uniref:CPBP family glutamic-type intramembrane protease n=1 Tax=Agrococcus casei TaxID=343512 RepID=UPI003F937043
MIPGRRSSGPMAAAGPETPARRMPWWAPLVACVVWLGLWWLTPGLLTDGVGSLFADDMATQVLIETVLALAVVVVIVLLHRRYNRVLFARSWSVWLYAVPVVLAITLPFHYELVLPVFLYMVWMTVSVFWQDYLTFGLLQSYLGERLPTWAAIVVSAVMFWLGHALLLPDSFAPVHWLPSLAILALGLVLASLRAWLKSLHLILALHLSFYFAFA